MADKTSISWTNATWNVITGCSVVSSGCENCYAMNLASTRLQSTPAYRELTNRHGKWNGKVRFNRHVLDQPLRWKKPRMIFVNAMGDLFYEDIPDEWIDSVVAVMSLAKQHTFQVLTKRADRMLEYFTRDGLWLPQRIHNAAVEIARETGRFGDGLRKGEYLFGRWPRPNIWVGVSAENQKTAVERIVPLLDIPAALRFVSLEPLLGPIDLTRLEILPDVHGGRRGFRAGIRVDALRNKHVESGVMRGRGPLGWVIVGGESGHDARPMAPEWARALRDQCKAAGIAFFMKQMTKKAPIPGDLLVRQLPYKLDDSGGHSVAKY